MFFPPDFHFPPQLKSRLSPSPQRSKFDPADGRSGLTDKSRTKGATMKIKPADKPGSVVVEVGPKDSQLLAPESAANQPPLLSSTCGKILVPIDFSDCSKQALKYAIAFAKQFRAAVTLLTVAPVFYTFSEFGLVDVPGLEKEREQQCQEQLKKLADQELHNEVPIQTAVRSGQPFQEIVEAAKDLEMDLIIIATPRPHRFDARSFGQHRRARHSLCALPGARRPTQGTRVCDQLTAHRALRGRLLACEDYY